MGDLTLKKATVAPYFMLLFAVLGIADAFYDSYAIYTEQLLWCPPPIDGCNTVANSPYLSMRALILNRSNRPA